MRGLRCGVVAALAAMLLGAALPGAAQRAIALAELRDHARVMLIFAPSASDARLQAQLRNMGQQAAEAADRDLVMIAVAEKGPGSTEMELTATDAATARHRFHVRTGAFLVVLLGKDGGEKLRSAEPIPFERLRDAIDAMPMRQAERKARGR